MRIPRNPLGTTHTCQRERERERDIGIMHEGDSGDLHRGHVMKNDMRPALWSYEDYTAGLCSDTQVGTEKPPPPLELPDLPPDLANVPSAILARDAMAAYQQLGGPHWLAANQDVLAKVLLKQIPLQAAVQTQTKTDIQVTISWATPDRLSYAKGDVIDMPAPALEHEPWKPAEPSKDPEVKFNDAMDALGDRT